MSALTARLPRCCASRVNVRHAALAYVSAGRASAAVVGHVDSGALRREFANTAISYATQRPQRSSPRPAQGGGGARGGGGGGSRGAPPERAPPATVDVPAHNEQLAAKHPELRVVGDAGENMGVMRSGEAVLAAKAKGLDLVLVNDKASPPVARFQSLVALLKERKDKAKKAAEEARSAKVKEVRLTSRTDEHDLGVKSGRVVEFLRGGHPVKVAVAFTTMAAAAKEEPARREVMAKVVRAVAEAGSGYADPGSIEGRGSTLSARFVPTKTPKDAGDWERVLTRLAAPIRPPPSDGGGRDVQAVPTPAGVAAVAVGNLPSIPAVVLPPDAVLARFTSRRTASRRTAHGGGSAGTPIDRDDFDDVPSTKSIARVPGEDEDDAGVSGAGAVRVQARRRGKAASPPRVFTKK